MEEHGIGWAVKQMQNGSLVRRAGWNGKGMHLYIEKDLTFTLPNVKEVGVFRGQTRTYEPCVCLYTAQGTHQPGWVCSQQDLLATDWELAE